MMFWQEKHLEILTKLIFPLTEAGFFAGLEGWGASAVKAGFGKGDLNRLRPLILPSHPAGKGFYFLL